MKELDASNPDESKQSWLPPGTIGVRVCCLLEPCTSLSHRREYLNAFTTYDYYWYEALSTADRESYHRVEAVRVQLHGDDVKKTPQEQDGEADSCWPVNGDKEAAASINASLTYRRPANRTHDIKQQRA